MTLPNPYDQPTLTVTEAAELLGVSRALAYAAIKSGQWPTPTFKVGTMVRIPTAALLRVMCIDGQGVDPTTGWSLDPNDWPEVDETEEVAP